MKIAELVGDFNQDEYENFCNQYGIDVEDGNQMEEFIYSLTDEEAEEIIKQYS